MSAIPTIMNTSPVFYYPGYPDQAKIMQDYLIATVPGAIENLALTAISATNITKGKELNDLVMRIVSGYDAVSGIDDLLKE